MGEKTYVVSDRQIGGSNMSASCIIGVQEKPLFLDVRVASNTSEDFLNFVVMAIHVGFLRQGDYFVYDNAAVHFGADTWRELDGELRAAGVVSIPLPCYSPELNPIERCFNVVKSHLRYHAPPNEDLLESALNGFSKVSPELVAKEYLSTLSCVCKYGTLVNPFE